MSLGFWASLAMFERSREAFILFVDSLNAYIDSLALEIVAGLLKSLPLRVAGSELSRFGYLSLDTPGAS